MKESDSPLFFSGAITSPLSFRLAYPGKGVNTGSDPGLLLVAKNALMSDPSLTWAATIILIEDAGFSKTISLERYWNAVGSSVALFTLESVA